MTDNYNAFLEPDYDHLVAVAGSKFTLVTMAASRARQINAYFHNLGGGEGQHVPPQLSTHYRQPLSIAMAEIGAGKLRARQTIELILFSLAESLLDGTGFEFYMQSPDESSLRGLVDSMADVAEVGGHGLEIAELHRGSLFGRVNPYGKGKELGPDAKKQIQRVSAVQPTPVFDERIAVLYSERVKKMVEAMLLQPDDYAVVNVQLVLVKYERPGGGPTIKGRALTDEEIERRAQGLLTFDLSDIKSLAEFIELEPFIEYPVAAAAGGGAP